jgi:hypothetical protein
MVLGLYIGVSLVCGAILVYEGASGIWRHFQEEQGR